MPVASCSDGVANTSREDSDNSVSQPLLSEESPAVVVGRTVRTGNGDTCFSDNAAECAEECAVPDIIEGRCRGPDPDKGGTCATRDTGDTGGTADEDDTASATMVVPPDGGWGWVVVAASFVCNFIVDGIIFCFGVFLVEIVKTFNVSTAKVALVGSLLTGFYLMTGEMIRFMNHVLQNIPNLSLTNACFPKLIP